MRITLLVPMVAVVTATTTARMTLASPAAVTADRLVGQALEADLAGAAGQRSALLTTALENDGQHPAAHWHLGHVQTDEGAWLTPEQIARQARGDEALDEYRQKRSVWGDSPAGLVELARWCRRQGLRAQESFHWRQILAVGKHPEAIARLQLKPFRGTLLTAEEISEWKQREREQRENLDTWLPRVKRWLRELQSGDATRRSQAMRQVASIRDATAIPALVKVFHASGDWRKEAAFVRQVGKRNAETIAHKAASGLVAALGNMPQHAATTALVDQAVFSPWNDVREDAIRQLEDRRLTDFVPLLVGNMVVAEVDPYVEQRGGMQMHGSRVFVETYDAKHFLGFHHTRFDLGPNRRLWGMDLWNPPGRRNPIRTRATSNQREERFVSHLQRHAHAMATRAKQLNARAGAVLAQVLSAPVNDEPRHWWNAWREYNELSAPTQKATYRRDYESAERLQLATPTSCFVRGTPVWTLTGLAPIESVQSGDRVLAQDPHTGELAFKTVLGTTYREPSPTVRLQTTAETIVATRGHRFWQAGHGWRMAKFLEAGSRLHGLDGSAAIERIEAGEDAESFNLVVDGFHTFFVGQTRRLVHDNSCPRPTQSVLPGWRPGR